MHELELHLLSDEERMGGEISSKEKQRRTLYESILYRFSDFLERAAWHADVEHHHIPADPIVAAPPRGHHEHAGDVASKDEQDANVAVDVQHDAQGYV
ncbi:hypothetical protein L6164_037368 [Bauhinia variegata]|uniref:Uncharacterized protein n=1 Tax=Bauhinia variegata TaxID=167791 RepID=A0ACB9KJT5_BAUVA|nr:hypothetical protein L6164_037368 [Bauhinia variegata]